MSRTFTIEAEVTVYRTVTYEVKADSFDEARDAFDCGHYSEVDYYEYDECIDGINTITCDDCGESDEDYCECAKPEVEVDTRFFAGIGL